MSKKYQFGNAFSDVNKRQWLVGSFIEPKEDIRSTKDVEVKWSRHKAGDKKKGGWTKNRKSTTLNILIEGETKIFLDKEEFLLSKQGDYLIWGPNVGHLWEIVKDSLILSVRWPSSPSDDVEAGDT